MPPNVACVASILLQPPIYIHKQYPNLICTLWAVTLSVLFIFYIPYYDVSWILVLDKGQEEGRWDGKDRKWTLAVMFSITQLRGFKVRHLSLLYFSLLLLRVFWSVQSYWLPHWDKCTSTRKIKLPHIGTMSVVMSCARDKSTSHTTAHTCRSL